MGVSPCCGISIQPLVADFILFVLVINGYVGVIIPQHISLSLTHLTKKIWILGCALHSLQFNERVCGEVGE